MTKRSPLPAPRLHRPTLPHKKALQAQAWHKPETLGKYINLNPRRVSIAKCDETPMPTANLIRDSSDDERKPIQDTTCTSSRTSSLERESRFDTDIRQSLPSPTARTGVYFENVEIQSEMHPLQSCCVQDGRSPLKARRTVSQVCGIPLSAAPLLPRFQSSLRPLSFPSLHSKRPRSSSVSQISNKKLCLDVLRELRAPRITADRVMSRADEVKEASFMIEAAVALSKLHSEKAN